MGSLCSAGECRSDKTTLSVLLAWLQCAGRQHEVCGLDHSSSATTNSCASCCSSHTNRGRNTEHQCGIEGQQPLITQPTAVLELLQQPVNSVVAGRNNSAAVVGGSEVFVWGEGSCGKLGLGSGDSAGSPSRVSGCLCILQHSHASVQVELAAAQLHVVLRGLQEPLFCARLQLVVLPLLLTHYLQIEAFVGRSAIKAVSLGQHHSLFLDQGASQHCSSAQHDPGAVSAVSQQSVMPLTCWVQVLLRRILSQHDSMI